MEVKKVCPSAEELKTTSSGVQCSEQDCSKIFASHANLTLHLAKTHKKKSLMLPKEEREFYCPEDTCMYHTNKFFKSMKQLKQHYLKVHASKNIICKTCQKGFVTNSQHDKHIEYCGVLFSCNQCEVQYPSYETLITHARRKGHRILEKACFAQNPHKIVMNTKKKKSSTNKQTDQKLSICQLLIVPVVEGGLRDNHVQKVTISTQTDMVLPKQKVKKPHNCREPLITKRNSQETQTSVRKKPKLTVQTQTTNPYNKKSNVNEVLTVNANELARKSIKTQTNIVPLKSASCNTSFSFNQTDFTIAYPLDCNTSSTQTYSDPLGIGSGLSSDSTLTDTSGIIDFNTTFDSNFMCCNSETQTDIQFDDELFKCDYYSNTCTQTSEDMLLGDIGFSDIETQTVIEDVLRSVESQTLMSHTMKNNSNYRDTSHIETQTDIEFKKMLEEINS